MGLQTAMYGLGQIVGPPLATRLVHQTGSFTASLLVAVVALVLGAALFALMTYQTRREAHLCLLQ
jgi:MFS-type transporter involved in bile tolerance (Atg22 family)